MFKISIFTLLHGYSEYGFWLSVSNNNSKALHTTDDTHSCVQMCLSPFFAG
jgi:hypothetical protein